MKKTALVLVVLALLAAPAYAQADKKPLSGYIGGGYSSTEGTTADFLTDGWNISGGVIIRPRPEAPFAFRADFGYNNWDATRELLDFADQGAGGLVQIDDGWGSIFSITADALLEFGGKSVGGYVGAGIGGYRRYVQLTEEVLVGGIWCDPWWGYCYEGVAPGDLIVADDKLTKFGYNGALGVTFNMPSGSQMFIEARYHHMDSKTPTEYVPFIFGFRW